MIKLVIQSRQSKGLIGGVRFEVKVHAILSPEQLKLVKHYNLANEVLLQKPFVNIWGQPTDHKLDIKVKNLLEGDTMRCKDLGEILAYTADVKSACVTLKAYLELASTFGGNEIIDI